MRQRMKSGHVLVTAAILAGAVVVLAGGYVLQPWEGEVPAGALEAGADDNGNPLYICVVSNWGGQHPGELAGGGCQVAWGGQAHRFEKDFMVLIGESGNWVKVGADGIPEGAFRAGGDEDGPMYVCRVEAWGGVHPGKLSEDRWCYVTHDGGEQPFTEGYEVLVE